ncbi:MAG: hypothetical protein ABIQ50_00345 [Usitatibacter sp.]
MLLLATQAVAQYIPVPYVSTGVRGRILDAQTNQAIEGAVVVARWEWLQYRRSHSGGHYDSTGQAVHIGEDISDREGRFSIRPWGPVTKVGGMMDEEAPKLIVFKAGYEPLMRGGTSQATYQLKKFTGEPRAYADLVAQMQHRGLEWTVEENSLATPKMVAALHRERLRLGSDGQKVLGAHRMPGREGKGILVDPATGRSTGGGIAWIEWTLQRADGAAGSRKVVVTQRPPHDQSGFFISPWRLPGPSVEGWVVDPTNEPRVRIYAQGYKRTDLKPWSPRENRITLVKVAETREGALDELRAWRKDIDEQLSGGPRPRALLFQAELLSALDFFCSKYTPDVRRGICFEGDEEVTRTIHAVRHRKEDTVEEISGGIRVITRNNDEGRSPVTTPVTPPKAPPTKPVNGFRIEAKP